MVYSPGPMEGGARDPKDLGNLEEKVDELERLADGLQGVPDEELVGSLSEAVGLLREINARIEAELDAAGEGSREAGALLDSLDFGPFDEALSELERRERAADEPGIP